PGYPQERLRYILADAGVGVVVTQGRLLAALEPTSVSRVVLDEQWQAIAHRPRCAPKSCVRAQNLAYVIYTSGSTGRSKAVAAEHGGMVNRLLAQDQIDAYVVDDVCYQKTSISFVDSLCEILGPLVSGLPLVIVPSGPAMDVNELARQLQRERVTRLISVPSLARELIGLRGASQVLDGLRHWSLSGEALSQELLQELHASLPLCCFVNLYGCSEVAADATACVVRASA